MFASALPVAALAAAVWLLAWVETGSFAASDWLIYAVLGALAVATVLLSGAGVLPARPALVGIASLLALAAWDAISIAWSAVPTLARDESLLVVFYAAVLAIPLVTLRTRRDRTVAVGVIVTALASLAVAETVKLLAFHGSPGDVYVDGRLSAPISYANGQGQLFLIGVWPAIALAARKDCPLAVRALAVGAATVLLSTLLETQTKGGAIALAVSTIAVFALSSNRLRLLIAALIAAAPAVAAVRPLTDPYRAQKSPSYLDTIHHAAAVLLVIAAISVAIGLAYALLDRWVTVPARVSRIAGIATLALVAAAVVVGVAGFFASVDHPGRSVANRWHDFTRNKRRPSASTHFVKFGSNRYDFYRVALRDFDRHPVAGIGARGFGPSYLLQRHSPEYPRRAHSLWLDALGETGVVGFALLAVGIGGVLLAALRRRADSLQAAAFAASVGWLAHATVDWIWTLPAVGGAFFLLLGLSASGDRPAQLRPGVGRAAGACCILIGLLVFAPPWVSARLARHGDYGWAKRLDPLSTDPYLLEGFSSYPYLIRPLQQTVAKEPRRFELHYFLAQAYLASGRRAPARRELRRALQLDPRDPIVRRALRKASAG